MKKRLLLLNLIPPLLFLLLLQSCGYRFGQGPLSAYTTLDVPLAGCDIHGTFTKAVIKNFKERSHFSIKSCQADLLLRLTLTELEEENVDYRSTAGDEGKPASFIVPVAARLYRGVQVELIDLKSGCVIVGPTYVDATSIFDFESDFARREMHHFALGELGMYDIAKDTATTPLHQILAKKVVDLILYTNQK